MGDRRVHWGWVWVTVLVHAPWVCVARNPTEEKRPNGDTKLALPDPTGGPRLATIAGASAEGLTPDQVAARVATLEERGRDASSGLAKSEFFLAAANLILSRELEPICTDRFLKIARTDAAAKTAQARSSLDRVDSLIGEARAALEAGAERSAELTRQADALTAFATAIRAYLELEADPDPTRTPRRAASGLSGWLEHDNPKIAAAAAFWQACLRSLEPAPASALAVLDPSSADPTPDGPRYGFFSRLLRCRLLAQRGSESLALGLLMQIEERVNEWFKVEADRLDAFRTIAWTQLRILQGWHDRLAEPTQAEERTWCDERMKRVQDEWLPKIGEATVLRLMDAVPLIVTAPADPAPADPPPVNP